MYKFKSELSDAPFSDIIIGGLCGCGSPFSPITLYRSEPLGQLWAPELRYDRELMEYRIIDINGNGFGDQYDDTSLIGNAYPSLNLSWQHRLQWKKVSLSGVFRGAFGHRIMNQARIFYEYKNVTSSYNAMVSKFFELNNAPYLPFGARHLESGSFLNLDNLFVSYNVRGAINWVDELEVFIGARNLLTFSGYQGGDPEVRYSDSRFSRSGQWQETYFDALIAGVGSRSAYPHSRTIFMGIKGRF